MAGSHLELQTEAIESSLRILRYAQEGHRLPTTPGTGVGTLWISILKGPAAPELWRDGRHLQAAALSDFALEH